MSLNKDGLTYDEKEAVIAQALATEEGRTALAQAMVEPIRRSLEYQAVGRKLLMVDELPQGALPRYERDVASTATVIARQGAVPDQIQEGEEVLVLTVVRGGGEQQKVSCAVPQHLTDEAILAFGQRQYVGQQSVKRLAPFFLDDELQLRPRNGLGHLMGLGKLKLG